MEGKKLVPYFGVRDRFVSKNSKSVKNLTVKNLKQKSVIPDNYQVQAFKKLHEYVIALQNRNFIDYSLEELYQAVEDLCNNNSAELLYNTLVLDIESHIRKILEVIIDVKCDNVSFINDINIYWELHCVQLLNIRSIFLYLDRTYIIKHSNVKSIWEMGLDLFCRNIILNSKVQSRISDGLLLLIEKERLGEVVNKTLLNSLVKMLISLNVYCKVFAVNFLNATIDFYSKESKKLILDLDVPQYLCHVEKRLNEEDERITCYLNEVIKQPLIHIVERQLIRIHIGTILQKGFEKMMHEGRLKDLKLIYSIFSRVNIGLKELCKYFNAYIKTQGRDYVTNPERDVFMVPTLLAFKDKLNIIVNKCFKDDIMFKDSLKEAFEFFINLRSNKPAELLAKYVDHKLKSTNKKFNEAQINEMLGKIIVLFRFIHEKDIFEAFYKKFLATRFLYGTSASIYAEKNMLIKLKVECGGLFTSKLEGMFKDMEINKDLNAEFKQYFTNINDDRLSSGIEVTINVITSGTWPSSIPMDIIMPKEIVQYQDYFHTFYINKYNGRKLQWQPLLGYCTLRSTFKQGDKELLVPTLHAAVLLLFNKYQLLQFKEIQMLTNIEEEELKLTLQSLACGKIRVLTKVPQEHDIGDEDEFSVNELFYNKLYKVKISRLQIEKNQTNESAITGRVNQDRQYQIDSIIVRIMKTRKSLMHNNLIQEVYSRIKFPFKPSDLKIRIESLIERDYIERDIDTLNQYNYRA